jgi:hypothetical protein
MKTTITQISNVFNLLSQVDNRIFNYHHGYRYDINQNITNNFDPANDTGRLFPAVMFDVPDNIKYIDEIDYLNVQEEIQCTLYFDDLQGYNNDGSQNILNPVEQWQRLKQIAEDFLANFRYLFEDKYGAGVVGKPTFVQRANLYNDRIITWEVSFQLIHAIPCTDEQYQIDPNDFPNDLDEDDLERTSGTPPTACDRIISQLNNTLLLTCVLPLYDFSIQATLDALSVQQLSDLTAYTIPNASCPQLTAGLSSIQLLSCILPTYDFSSLFTQNALSSQQVLDLKTWLLPTYDFADVVWQNLLTVQQITDLTTYLLPLVDFTDANIQNLLTTQQKDDIISWLLPLVDFSDPAIQAIITVPQQTDLQNWLCTPASTQMYRMSFDGVNEFIQTPNNAALDFTNVQPFSAAIWAQSTNYSATQTLLSRRSLGTTRGYVFFFLSGHLHLYMGTSVTNYIYIRTTGVTFTNNVQYLLGFTKDSTSTASGVKLYVNGVSVSTFTIQDNLNGTLSNSQALLIGADNISGWYFSGFLGLSRLWGAELTAGQMLTEYNSGTPLNTPQLLGIQRFGWKAGQDAYFGQQWVFPDESGNMTNPLPYSINSELADRQAI